MVKKWKLEILNLVAERDLKSTTQILHELEKKVKRRINWSDLHRTLSTLKEKNLIKCFECKGGIYWIKK